MENINDNLEICLNIIHLPNCNKEDIESILSQIKELLLQQEPINIHMLAELFYLTLTAISDRKDIIDSELELLIRDAFFQIKSMYSSIDDNSSIYEIILNFLQEINLLPELYTTIEDPISQQLAKKFPQVCEHLERINFVFRIKHDDRILFPLNSLLAYLLTEEMDYSSLTTDKLYIFVLAMEIFDETNPYRIKLEDFAQKHNIEWLALLANKRMNSINNIELKDNFLKNDLLVLIDNINNEIYIRNTNPNYFNGSGYEIKEETNSALKPIAYFIKIPCSSDTKFLSIDDIFQSNNSKLKIEALEYIYDRKYYNVFMNKMFYINENKDHLECVNPFAYQDKFVIIPNNVNGTQIYPATLSAINNGLSKFKISEIWKKKEFDSILLGSILIIFTIFKNITIKSLDECFQSCIHSVQKDILKKCFLTASVTEIINFVNEYFEKIQYITKQELIEKEYMNDIVFWPYQLPDSFISQELINYCKTYYSFDLDNEAVSYIRIRVEKDFYNSNTFRKINDDEVISDTVLYDKDYEFKDEDYYFLQKDSKYYFSELINQYGRLINLINKKNEAIKEFSYLFSIPKITLDSIYEKMKLQQLALCYKIKGSYETIFSMRLFHHLIYNNINSLDKFTIFMQLINNHRTLSFSFVKDMEFKKNVLYIPKDSANSDSVLLSINDQYIHNKAERDFDLFNNIIELKDGEYYRNNHKISKIVYFFDNIERGKATVDTIFAYNDINSCASGKIQDYICNNSPLKIKTIIDRNNITDIEILALYGSNEGKQKIKEKLHEKGINISNIDFKNNLINNSNETFINNVKEIYGNVDFCKDYYPVIREFNQPKKNIFPKKCLNASNIASIFVCKKELPFT